MTSATPAVAVVSDVLVDVVERADGRRDAFPGGAGLNLAVGLCDLGGRTRLAAPIGTDAEGRALRAAIEGAGIEWVPLPGHPRTPRAASLRVDGEPRYSFSAEVAARHYVFDEVAVESLRGSSVIAVNSYPLGDPDEVRALRDLVRRTGSSLVLDPNVRPELVSDLSVLHRGLLDLAEDAVLVKLSEDDAAGLRVPVPDLTRDLLERGVAAVVVTRAAAGAEVWTQGSVHVATPVARRPTAVMDTMGAGDAVLAHVIHHVGASGAELDHDEWSEVLRGGMERAADVCRHVGGNRLRALEIAEATRLDRRDNNAPTEGIQHDQTVQ